jgi:hypothetical protein
MPSTSKSMPVLPKILIALAVLGVIYVVSVNHRGRAERWSDSVTPSPTPDYERRIETRPPDGAEQQLAQYQSQLSQVMAQVNQCNAQNDAFAARMANGMATADQYPPATNTMHSGQHKWRCW